MFRTVWLSLEHAKSARIRKIKTTIKNRTVLKAVTRNVLLYLSNHVVDGLGDCRLIRLFCGDAMHGVAHDQRWLGRIQNNDRLALLRPTNGLDST